jgi:hypothetical protein
MVEESKPTVSSSQGRVSCLPVPLLCPATCNHALSRRNAFPRWRISWKARRYPLKPVPAVLRCKKAVMCHS